MVRRTPQEKKRLSYAKDCRNTYRENAKSSRRNIPRHRQRVHRANRRHAGQDLRAAVGQVDETNAERVEDAVLGRRQEVFDKAPDKPLGWKVTFTLRNRVVRGMSDEDTAEARIQRVRSRFRID